MPTSSLISNSNSVTDDSDEDDYVSDEDYDYENFLTRPVHSYDSHTASFSASVFFLFSLAELVIC